MKVQAIELVAKSLEGPFLRSHLELENSQDLEKARERDLPVAYVVRLQHLGRLREFKGLVIDRGTKHQAKSLSGPLLGKEKIPLIAGQYRDPGQLRRSVRTLLANALRQDDRNLYLIGVGEAIFEEVWKHAMEPEMAHGVKMSAGARRSQAKFTSYSEESSVSARELLRIIGEDEEPHGLAERYVGESEDARLVRQLILRAARRDCRVLIVGPTGTGKEIVARAIHELSKRRSREFIAVNCGAFSPHLLESELFGHVKGAFTGAWRRKIGVWQMADHGTLFLDEIGDISKEQQGKILRMAAKGIRTIGRATQGVRLIEMEGDDRVVSIAKLAEKDEEEDREEEKEE